jgi:hypothetical protein
MSDRSLRAPLPPCRTAHRLDIVSAGVRRASSSLWRLAGSTSHRLLLVLAASTATLAVPVSLAGQDSNILYPVDYIEERLLQPLQVLDMERTRQLEEDRSRRVVVEGSDGEPAMEVHWKPVGRGAQGFNNEPRYELAAYRFQKLFLDEPDYVVPPAVLRALPLEEYRSFRSASQPTIRGTSSVLFLLSYWIQNLAVDTVDPFDPTLFDLDETYAWHFANANILTHLIDHKDGNHGNVLVSMDHENRRVFAVDNDVAFSSRVSDQGDRWRHLQVERLPAATIDRLREVTREDLERKVAVVAEFEIVDGYLHPVEPGENLSPRRGVRVTADRVQFGLTPREIRDVERNIQRLLRDVDRGRIATF